MAIKIIGDNSSEQISLTPSKIPVRKQTQETERPLDLGTWIKIFAPKQRLPIALAEVKACNMSENLLN